MSDVEIPQAEGTLENALDPRAHDNLFGHETERERIVHAFAGNRFPQAWLITGQMGIGKATLAWHFARQIVDNGSITSNFRARPESLERYSQHNHPQIYSITRPHDDKKGFKAQIPIESVRNLSEKMQFATTEGGWRAVIIDPMEAINTAGANALLKLLEEPPARVVFFLISHAPNLLLPTIKSRCQIIRLQGLSVASMRENWNRISKDPLPDDAALALADGSIRAALTTTNELAEQYELALKILAQFPRMPHAQFHAFASQMNTGNRSETLMRAKDIFGLMIGRIIRAATTTDITRETELVQKIAQPTMLGKWAEIGFITARELDDAARLNLDAEIAIFHRWCAIEEMLKS